MAKSSISPMKSLKRLFTSKSTTDLQECGEKQESKFHTLFKRREKKKDKRVESPDPASAEEHNGADLTAASVYATVPRSKKGLFSHSETDLRKPKRFATFSFAWKKKKNRNLSQSSSTINVESEVRGHIREPEEEDKLEQTSLRQPVHSEVSDIESVDNEAGSTHGEDSNAEEYMIANIKRTSMSYIDDSGSDGYCTPPESPDLGSSQSLTVNSNEIHQSYSKYCKIHSEQLLDTTTNGAVEVGSNLSVLTSTESSKTSSSNSPARIFEGHLTPVTSTPSSTVASSINSTFITEYHPERNISADSRDHSLVLHQWDTAKKIPQWFVSPDSTSHRDVVEKFEEVNANLALGDPEQSSSQRRETSDSENRPSYEGDVSLYKPVIGFHRDHSHIIDDTSRDNETFRKTEENMDHIAGPDYVLFISPEVPGELVPLSCPDDMEITYSTTEIYSSTFAENDANAASRGVPLGYPEIDLSTPLTKRSIMVSDPDPATFDLLHSSYTRGLNHSNNFSNLFSELDHPTQEQGHQEPTIFTSLPFEMCNKSSYPESISAGTDHLTSYSYISDLSHQPFREEHGSEKCKGNNLEADKSDEEGSDETSLASKSSWLEKMCYSSAVKEPHGFTENYDSVYETVMHGNDFNSFKAINNNLNKSVNRKCSQDNGNVVVLNTEENLTRNQEHDMVEPIKFQDEDMLGSFSMTTKIKENVEEKTYVPEQVFVRDEVDTQICLSGECEETQSEVDPQLEDLTIIKLDMPVLQVCVSEECVTAPPCSLHGEVSVTDCKIETHPNVETGSGHSQECGSPIPPQWEDSTGGGANGNVVGLHVARDDINTQETEKRSVTYYRIPRFEPQGLPETQDIVQQIQERQNSTDQQHKDLVENIILQSENAVDSRRDTCRIFTERSKTQDGVIVCIREFSEEEQGHHESTRVRSHSDYQPAPRNTSLGRFPHAFSFLSTVIEESDTEVPVETCPESDTDMNVSHVGVLSTTLTLRPKVSLEGREDGKKVHKVSLVNSSSTTNSSVLCRHAVNELENGVRNDTVDNGTRPEMSEGWKPRHDGHRVFEGESSALSTDRWESEVSGGTYLYSSLSSSSEYEPAVRTSLPFFSERECETLPSAVSLDAAGSHGNITWWNARSEVQASSESQAGGRSWAGLAESAGESEVKGDVELTNTDSHYNIEETDGFLSGVFKATRVELSPTEADPETPTLNSPHDMDTLLDTLKSMPPPIRQRSLRSSSSLGFSSLPPIVEDATSTAAFGIGLSSISSPTSPAPAEPLNSLPSDLGLNWSTTKDMRSPLTMMSMLKEQQGQDPQGRSLILPQRASALNSIVMRKGSLPNISLDEGSKVNGIFGTSRLDNSLLFSNYRSEQTEENGKPSGHRSLFRAASLPEVSSGQDYLSKISKGPDSIGSTGSTNELSFLTSPLSSLPGLIETSRISRSPLVTHSPTSESPTSNTPPVLHSLSTESPVKPPNLQWNLSIGTSSIGSPVHNGIGNNITREPEPDRNLLAKYKAFPDAYLTKEKEHGKLNPRPGKMFIYNRPGRRGQRIEVKGDVMDATEWEFPENISIRVIRGGWVLYEKPDFKGEKVALDEGDIELTNPFGPPEDEPRAQQNGEQENSGEPTHTEPRRFVIGSLRRAVRDYSVPEICLFPEENAEGKKVVFRDTSDDARIYGFPVKANSIIINAGLWLVFAEPFFQGAPRVLEVGGFPNPAAWGVTQPYVGSLHPLKIGEPRVERPNEPKLVIYDKPYFTGKSREIYTNMRDFISRTDQKQTAFMYSVGSMKVIGGIWVGYEKEGFRGHQYLLEEGEYHDWRTWGGCNSELRSVRVIRTDLSNPMLVMFEMSKEEEEEEERTFEVTEAIPDVELFDFNTSTRSIDVISGVWVAYSHVDYSGNQYVLEKGFYNSCADWGAGDNRICSVQPVLPALADSQAFRSELLLYTEPNFQGTCQIHCESEEFLSERRSVQSCRVVGGSWVLYDANSFSGNQYILSEGDYANLTSMGCANNCVLRSVKPVPISFTVPAISLFGLECFEGREVTMETEVSSMMEGGFNPHFLSVRINSGCWVLCEHSNYRGRQFLLEPLEITNWPKFSSLTSIGSLYPIREKCRMFRVCYKESGLYMSVQGGVDTMKTGRVVVSENVEGVTDVWFYQDGLIKNKLVQGMSLQVVGNVEPGAKVVLWSETRTPIQTWSAKLSGSITSLTFPGLLLDVKGGKTYDKEHVIVRNENEDTPTPIWDIQLI